MYRLPLNYAEMTEIIESAPQDITRQIRRELAAAALVTGDIGEAANLVSTSLYREARDQGLDEEPALKLAEYVMILAVHAVATVQGGQSRIDDYHAAMEHLEREVNSAFDGL